MNLKRFPFSSSSLQIDEVLKIGLLQISKMFKGRILFIHVAWLLRLPRLMPFTSPGGCNLHLTKQNGVVFNHLCLMLKLSCEDPSFACHVLGLFLQIPPGLEHNLFDSIAC